jgi:DNA-binding GntR family transcriptional regulator
MLRLERRGAAPLYSQIEALLLQRIRKEYRPGQLLPPQKDLATKFGVSLITVKRALQEIARRGFLESTRGRGTVVVRPHVQEDPRAVTSWTDSMTGLGRQPRTAWCRVGTRVPPPEIARLWKLKARERTVRVERLRTLDGDPFCLMTNELPLALAPELAEHGLADESLYGWLKRRHGYAPLWADEEVEARRPNAREVRELGPETQVVIIVHRVAWLSKSRPLEVARMIAPAHRYRYRAEIVHRGKGPSP